MSENYQIIIQPEARRGIEQAYEWIKEESPASAVKWFNGILKAISSLEILPTRCALAPEDKDIGREVRQLLYGKRGNMYRIIFVIRDNEVHVLYVRHSKRQSLMSKREESEQMWRTLFWLPSLRVAEGSQGRHVLRRPNTTKRLPGLTVEGVEAFLEDIIGHAVTIRNVPEKFRYERDPEDEPYINLAAAVAADYIVSRDKDLLDLTTGTTVECKEFRQRFRPLKVIEPLDFLREFTQEEK